MPNDMKIGRRMWKSYASKMDFLFDLELGDMEHGDMKLGRIRAQYIVSCSK